MKLPVFGGPYHGEWWSEDKDGWPLQYDINSFGKGLKFWDWIGDLHEVTADMVATQWEKRT